MSDTDRAREFVENFRFPPEHTSLTGTHIWIREDEIPACIAAYAAAETERLTQQWRCFHCDFVATTQAEAEAHFGERDDAEEFTPICKWWADTPEQERLREHQDLLRELNQERDHSGELNMKLETAESALAARRSASRRWRESKCTVNTQTT